MVEFLSDAWLDAMAAAASRVGDHDRRADDPPAEHPPAEHPPALTLRQVVTGGPHGDVLYDLHLADGRVTVDRSGTAVPDVTIEQDHETAGALVRGDTHPHLALTGGRLDISGAAHRLTAWRSTLDELDEALADLRAETTW